MVKKKKTCLVSYGPAHDMLLHHPSTIWLLCLPMQMIDFILSDKIPQGSFGLASYLPEEVLLGIPSERRNPLLQAFHTAFKENH